MEEDIFLKSIHPQNCGDSLRVLRKTNKKQNWAYYYEVEFIKYKFKTKAVKSQILKGNVANLNCPNKNRLNSYLGEGPFSSKNEPFLYNRWDKILQRCNSNCKYYNNSLICEEWLNFQNFAIWCKNNSSWNVNNYPLEIDKDILCNIQHLEQKVYSPNTCLLIPGDLNGFLAGDNKFCGVDKRENGKFRAKFCNKTIGTFDTFEEAKLAYAFIKMEKWKKDINKFVLPLFLKDILLKYDFTWNWQ